MTHEEYYGPALPALIDAEKFLRELIDHSPWQQQEDTKSILYHCTRIKSPESMMRKLETLGLPTDCSSALAHTFDAVGLQIICAFTEDVYAVVSWLKTREELDILREKDYIAYSKPNGYRSYHLQLWLPHIRLPAEIQVRTIATDFWASLDHQLKYKQDIPQERLICSELKRCADEIASVDLSMQTIRDITQAIKTDRSKEDFP